MGIVCSTTSIYRSVGYSKMCPIQRQKIKKVANLIKNKGISVTTYIPPEESGLSKLMFKSSAELIPSFCEPENFAPNFLWHTAIFLKNIERPDCSVYLSNVCMGKYPEKSAVNLLPVIGLDPSNDADADVMIVTETIKLAAEITVFSDDTDVLVLFMYN